MSDDEFSIDYGKLTKKIIFADTDDRHARFLVRLRHDGLNQSKFFRMMITGYLKQDDRITDYIDTCKDEAQIHSKAKRRKSKKLADTGKQITKDFALSEDEVDNIFDLLEQEHPEL